MSHKEKFFTERDKTLFKLFFLVFLFFMFVLNWTDFSGIFHLKTAPQIISKTLEDVFTREEKKDVIREEEIEELVLEEEDKEEFLYCEEDRVNVPALDITAPIVETQGTTEKEYREALDGGVVRFPGSVFPGEYGLSVLLGHSAPPGWPDINYDRIFTEIERLEEGDLIEVCYNNKLFHYYVIDEERGKKIYEIGEEVPLLYPQEEKRELVIMTCWPPGQSESRMGVRAVAE